MTMKRFLCAMLSAVIVFAASAYSSAASDKCIKLSDTTGDKGYSAASDELNAKVAEAGGATLIFDVMAESLATPPSGKHSRITVFTGGPSFNLMSYDFTEGAFTAVDSPVWLLNQESFEPLASQAFNWEVGKWYELAFQFEGNVATAYVDGMPMISAEFDSAAISYLIIYPQFCDLRIDNMRICSKDYNVRDRYGDVWAVDDFSSATSVNTQNWGFSGGGYSISDGGRVMPELNEMLPDRVVSPAIEGSYLRHSGGTGISNGMNFTEYNGFTVVWDVRFDSLSSSAHTAVRVGTTYIAGYDVRAGAFEITTVAGFGFSSTSYNIFAKTPYTIQAGVTYEMAVRQYGDCVSVYLNGVLMAKAQDSKLSGDLSLVYLSNYSADTSIDNMIVAYPDFNVRERTGSRAAELTFDESPEVITAAWDFPLGNQTYGYSIVQSETSPVIAVSSDTANSGSTAMVSLSLENTDGITAFEAEVTVPETLTVASVDTVAGVYSPDGSNPIRLEWLGSSLNGGNIMTISLKIPIGAADGETFTVNASLTLYKDTTKLATLTASGTVTAKTPVLPVLPTGLAFNGTALSWNAAETASSYEVFLRHGDTESSLGQTNGNTFTVDAATLLASVGDHTFTVYARANNGSYVGRSDTLTVVRDSDLVLYNSVDEFKAALSSKIDAFINAREYLPADAAQVSDIAAAGKAEIADAQGYTNIMSAYSSCLSEIEAVPTKADRENTPRISVGSATVKDGYATISVAVAKNPGLAMLDLSVAFDTDALTLVSLSGCLDESDFDCANSSLNSSPVTVNIQALNYVLEDDCDLFELKFAVKEGTANGTYPVTVSVDSAYDADFSETSFLGGTGVITVDEGKLLGDVNGDGVVNSADSTLITRKLAGWDVSIDSSVGDVNGDGVFNGADATLITRKLAGWNVEFAK